MGFALFPGEHTNCMPVQATASHDMEQARATSGLNGIDKSSPAPAGTPEAQRAACLRMPGWPTRNTFKLAVRTNGCISGPGHCAGQRRDRGCCGDVSATRVRIGGIGLAALARGGHPRPGGQFGRQIHHLLTTVPTSTRSRAVLALVG